MDDKLNILEDALATFEATLAPALPADVSPLVKSRFALARAVNAFFADNGDLAPMLGAALIDSVEQAQLDALQLAFVAFRKDYSAHIARWNNRTIATSWVAYREQSVALVRAMRALLRRRDQAIRNAA